ncbi:MAG TPA: ComEA family DNA-binding protein [Fimbriimonadaceae bacterium]|nr:ComEA family DNA-binding protein [Fimbriimonadaceae bacterium]
MQQGMGSRQRLGVFGLSALGVVAAGVIGASYVKRPAPIVLDNNPVASSTTGRIMVHVIGAVKKPGVVRLSAGSRVQDALDAAGGPVEGADLSGLNLAALLADGTQIKVGSSDDPGSSTTDVAEPSAKAPSKASGGTSEALAPASISINTADSTQLDLLPGVGPATAAKIIEYRSAHGGFRSIDELEQVKGIGPKKLAKMRPFLKL